VEADFQYSFPPGSDEFLKKLVPNLCVTWVELTGGLKTWWKK